MMRVIYILIIVMLACPALYVIFFTSLIDKILLRLRTGGRSRAIEEHAEDINRAARDHAEELRWASAETERALKKLEELETPGRRRRKPPEASSDPQGSIPGADNQTNTTDKQ